jgi:hypothetical protein
LFENEIKLRKQFDALPAVKDWSLIKPRYKMIETAYAEAERMAKGPHKDRSFNAVDQTLITTFNKILDPGSVVRESEYARTQEGAAKIEQFRAFVARITAGGVLSMKERKALRDMSAKFYSIYKDAFEGAGNQYRNLAKQYGLNPERIVPRSRVGIVPRQGRAGSKTIVRTGTDSATGRSVIQYSDGSIEYAD